MITAVDIGATKTLVAQFGEDGKAQNEVRFPTPEDPAVFVTELLRQLKDRDITAISVGVPGLAKEGVIVRCLNLPLWKNVRLASHLQDAHPNVPILIENDARLAGLAEINALPTLPPLGLYLTVSTGIGGGLVAGGRLTPEAAEWGHMVLAHNGDWIEWERFASGRALVEHFGKIAAKLTTPEQWQWVAEQISAGLSAIIPALEPDAIVFGGGVGNFFLHFQAPLNQLLEQRLPHYVKKPTMTVAKHPNEAVLYGCYYSATHAIIG